MIVALLQCTVHLHTLCSMALFSDLCFFKEQYFFFLHLLSTFTKESILQ